jgi:hypothetical protein
MLDSEEILQTRIDNDNDRHRHDGLDPNDNLRWISDGDMITPCNGCSPWIYQSNSKNGGNGDNG